MGNKDIGYYCDVANVLCIACLTVPPNDPFRIGNNPKPWIIKHYGSKHPNLEEAKSYFPEVEVWKFVSKNQP